MALLHLHRVATAQLPSYPPTWDMAKSTIIMRELRLPEVASDPIVLII